MRLDDCIKAIDAYHKLDSINEELNFLMTKVLPDKEGIPIALKDNICTKGILTTASCKLLDNYVPVYNATIVDKLEKAGFVTIAKTSMDELGMGGSNLTSFKGSVKNPYDTNRISGGSSGGSAVIVASGLVPVAVGTDTGDSIRKPAAYNGIVGVKPTYGRISRFGIIPYASSLDHVGYFTTCIKDAAKMLEVLAGRDDKDMTSSNKEVLEYSILLNKDIKGRKLLVFNNVLEAITNKTILDSFNNIINELKKRGAIIEHVSFDETLMKAILPTYYIIANAEASANHSNLVGINFGHRIEGKDINELMINTRTHGFGPWIKKRFVIGSYALFLENQDRIFRKAQKIRRLIVNEIMAKLKDADCLIAPSAPSIAPKITDAVTNELTDEYLIADNHMIIENFAGLPSLSMPMGFVEGLPIGINVSCNPFKEDDMFNIAYAIEDITGLTGLTKEEF